MNAVGTIRGDISKIKQRAGEEVWQTNWKQEKERKRRKKPRSESNDPSPSSPDPTSVEVSDETRVSTSLLERNLCLSSLPMIYR